MVAAGCTLGAGSNPSSTMTVTITPSAASVRAGDVQQFSASVTGSSNTTVTWAVNGVAGGNATFGTIDTTGKFTAPDNLPTPNSVSVQATSQASPAVQGTSAVTLMNPIPVVSAVNPTLIGTDAFTMVVTGSKFVSGAKVLFGGNALTTTFVSSTQLTASGTATAGQVGSVTVRVQNPDPGIITSTTSKAVTVTGTKVISDPTVAARFLEQSSFGPTTTAVAQLQYAGFAGFLNDQFVEPMSTYPDPAPTVNTLTPTQQVFFTNALAGFDQLRQRVAFVLSEIWVTSGNTIPAQGMAPYMRLLSQDAFANYRTIMQDVTLSPAMGRYLDMVNNDKPNLAANTHANENYARELLQLFTVGLYLLNPDGTLQHDTSGNPIPTYDQNAVQGFARAFTGWTYPTQPGSTLQIHNPPYWIGPMEVLESNHDTGPLPKPLLNNVMLPAGQSSSQDLKDALDNIFTHPNVPPFISKQLIQHLVTSNPSTTYVKDVADAFTSGRFSSSFGNFGSGQRGDMQAVIAAILLDPEARRGDSNPPTANPSDGHLREPILYITSLLRAFGATSDGLAPVTNATNMGQNPLRSPSVFNFFPPDFQIPGTTPPLLGPEFDLQTSALALVRINFVNSFVYGSIGGTTVDFTPWANVASDPNQLIDSLNRLLLHGTLSASTRSSILTAVNAVPGPVGAAQNLARARAAIYLIASSSQYQVEQ